MADFLYQTLGKPRQKVMIKRNFKIIITAFTAFKNPCTYLKRSNRKQYLELPEQYVFNFFQSFFPLFF